MDTFKTQTPISSHILRLTDIDQQPYDNLGPIVGYKHMPLVSLEEAIKPLIPLIPKIEDYVYLIKRGSRNPQNGLTHDESASIALYTWNWEPYDDGLYVTLNKALRNKDRQDLQPWFLFLKLFLTALDKLPPTSPQTVFRGTKSNESGHYHQGEIVTWRGFSSCTNSIETLETKDVIGKTGPGTIFAINCYSGKNIQAFSYDHSEVEIVLSPRTRFKVAECIDCGPDTHLIRLIEIHPPQEPSNHDPVQYVARGISCMRELPPKPMTSKSRGYDTITMDTDTSSDESK